ncbi:MAG: penicillin-binding protein [Actinomycetota bacterium]|jgi:peptidoglycan glycosyltransferase|nr:penicillin-binding protein [Actinomycetota bacterium]
MNIGIRRVGAAMMILFLGLVAQLTYLQVVDSSHLQNDPRNVRKFLQVISRPRGEIVTSEGLVLAKSVPVNDEFKYQRVYTPGTAKLFAQVVGFQSIQFGSVGVEAKYSSELAGRNLGSLPRQLSQGLSARQQTGTVVLSMSAKAQLAAAGGLADRRGSVVVLDVKTGGVVAMYSNPTFDPTPLASHDSKKAQAARQFLLALPDNPMLARAWRELYPPGSTFKTVTASTALSDNVDVNKRFPFLTELPLPLTTSALKNFGGERCGGSLEEGFVQSCNTTFGQIGLDLGEQLATGVQRFGVNTNAPPSDLDPNVVRSLGPAPGSFHANQPLFAQAAIGQGPVAVTPLEMALVAESVATGGVILQPHVAARIEDADGTTVRTIGSKQWRRAMDPVTAATMKQFMLQVVQRGTGTAAQIPGVEVAGKTGTAETAPGAKPHAWFIAFAPADHPRYAISVIVEHGGTDGANAEVTGGRVAAPIAASVLRVLLGT